MKTLTITFSNFKKSQDSILKIFFQGLRKEITLKQAI